MHFCFCHIIYSTQVRHICSFSMYSLSNAFLKDSLVMQDKPGENQKLFSTPPVQLCPSCTFSFEGAVKIGSNHSTDTNPWSLTTLFLTPNLLTNFANLLVLVNSSNNLIEKFWKDNKIPEWLRWSHTKQ